MKKLILVIFLVSYFWSNGNQTPASFDFDRFPSIFEKIEKEKLEKRKKTILEAIIQHESRGDVTAHNKVEDAVGILQIRRIYVDECNRILKKNKFRYEDRKDPNKSIEMFNIMMGYYAPDYDFDKVCMVHNAGGISERRFLITEGYRGEVNKIYQQLIS